MDHELSLGNQTMVHMDPSMFDNVNFEHMMASDPQLLGSNMFQHPPLGRGPEVPEMLQALPPPQAPQMQNQQLQLQHEQLQQRDMQQEQHNQQ
jgi:hypothetical protein